MWKKLWLSFGRTVLYCNKTCRLVSSRAIAAKKPLNHIFTLGATFSLINKVSLNKNDEKWVLDARLAEDMQNACDKSVEALVELMRTLNVCMSEIHKEYTNAVEKQIELTKACDDAGPLGEHWDQITQYRVQAEDLKIEFNKYEMLVKKIGQMVFYQAVTALMSGNEKELDKLNLEFNKLEKVVRELASENKKVDQKLLMEHQKSILITATK